VIVTAIANRSELPITPSSRLLVHADGSTLGAIHPRVDAVLRDAAVQHLERGRPDLISFHIGPGGVEPAGRQGGDLDVFFEVLARPSRLVIVGAGHIALPLARMAKLLDFVVTIVDDRPELASRVRFPEADELLIGEYRALVSGLEIDRDTYIVLVTRGHVHDQACLEEVLPSDAAYIGMIGSKRRVRTVLAHARENGADPERLRRVHAPIGLDINALTPAEIAVAIMAEIVNLRRGGNSPSLALGDRARV
jgi:xanthine dehydrogenase accessory factor